MKIGNKDGKVCVREAHLPITIEIKNVQETNAIHVEEHGEPEELYDDELGDSKMGDRLKYHITMIRIHLESLDDEEIAEAWIKKCLRSLFNLWSILINGMTISKTKSDLMEKAEEHLDERACREAKKRIEEVFDGFNEQAEVDLPKAGETPITKLDLGNRAFNALAKMAWEKGYEPPFGNVMLSEFKGVDYDEFYGLNGVGVVTVGELKEEFKNYSWE